jgi:hypothetical protein
MVDIYNYSIADIVYLYQTGKDNVVSECDTKILNGELSMPNIGICDESSTTLLVTCFVTFCIQFVRHWLWDLTSVHKFNILSKDHGKRDWSKIAIFSLIQLGKSLLWVVSLLIVVNANLAVIITHVIADVVACAYWIWKTKRFNKNPLDTERIIEAIKKEPEVWENFIKANKAWYEFERLNNNLPDNLKKDVTAERAADHQAESFSNSSAVAALRIRRQTLNF